MVHGEVAPVDAETDLGLAGRVACVQELSGVVEHAVPVLIAADFAQRFTGAVNLAAVFAAVGVCLDEGVFDAQFRSSTA